VYQLSLTILLAITTSAPSGSQTGSSAPTATAATTTGSGSGSGRLVAWIVGVSMDWKADSRLVPELLPQLAPRENLELLPSRPHQLDFGYPSYSHAASHANMYYSSIVMHLRRFC
jgi:hypothetical protein